MKKKFNPQEWLENNDKGKEEKEIRKTDEGLSEGVPNPPVGGRHDGPINNDRHDNNDVEIIISRIEAAQTDITASYADWRDIGFALADEFGESGRDYYHRVSRFYSGYSLTDCNKQFDSCLKATPSSRGHGITIKTFFHLAKQAGIDVRAGGKEHGAGSKETGEGRPEKGEGEKMRKEEKELQDTGSMPPAPSSQPSAPCPDLPTLPDEVYVALPDFLQKVVAQCTSNEERDILLLGSLVTLSSCLPKVYGVYDGKRVYPNLYLFITAQASAGKGRLVHCKQLVKPVHWELRKETHQMKQQYEVEMREYNLQKGKDFNLEKPVKPPEKMLIIPANNSTTGVFQLLFDNGGKGLIFETEGDTLAQAFKSDYGNYSDGFRKAFHHETISYYRRTDREYVEIESPCLSTVLSGTPKQVATLIPNAENGLFSRFIFYFMNIKPVWKNVFASNNDGLEVYFDGLGQEFLPLYKALNENPAIRFCLTDEQQDQFHTFFKQIQEKYLTLQGMDYMATIRRLGLIAFRIAMVFTSLRLLETGDFSEKQVCTDEDFQTAISMVRILVKHSSHVYSELPEDVKPTGKQNKKEQFLDQLPGKFSHNDFIALAKKLAIAERSAVRYITIFCEKGLIRRENQGTYTNLSPGERQ